MNEDKYYESMCNFDKLVSFEDVRKEWFKCFSYVFKKFNKHYNNDVIKDLFDNFNMNLSEAMHLENTEYAKMTQKELKECFDAECNYICDRVCHDRLFRTHWLFKQTYRKELSDEFFNF